MSAPHNDSPPSALRRAATLAIVVVAAPLMAWLTWPRPDVHIRVERGGTAVLIGRLGARPLPDTIVAHASGPVRVRIENRDTLTHRLGIFGIARERTSDFTIAQPGVYSGYCSAHPARALTYVVR